MVGRRQIELPEDPEVKIVYRSSSTPEIIAMISIILSSSLQFLEYLEPLFGSSSIAVSGATVLAVSISFTGLTLAASYTQFRQNRHYDAALEDISEISDSILDGRRTAVRIASFKVKEEKTNKIA